MGLRCDLLLVITSTWGSECCANEKRGALLPGSCFADRGAAREDPIAQRKIISNCEASDSCGEFFSRGGQQERLPNSRFGACLCCAPRHNQGSSRTSWVGRFRKCVFDLTPFGVFHALGTNPGFATTGDASYRWARFCLSRRPSYDKIATSAEHLALIDDPKQQSLVVEHQSTRRFMVDERRKEDSAQGNKRRDVSPRTTRIWIDNLSGMAAGSQVCVCSASRAVASAARLAQRYLSLRGCHYSARS